MNRITEFLFEAMLLKRVQRTGYAFLGPGKESVAEHTFGVMCAALALSAKTPAADRDRVLMMCLVHDLPEARMGDLNAVQKRYVTADEKAAVADMTQGLSFGPEIAALMDEFNAGETLEAKLAGDADQLAFLLDLKSLSDMGYAGPEKWSAHIKKRLRTDAGQKLFESIEKTEWDSWWYRLFCRRDAETPR
ncbi:HD domain-containing protein [Desulfosarcina sp. OttesenSCG-928-G10]|nr:HD domain-containing protein [Desulfosarcina sp. OttesenSCG-928-G10]MDL2320791.1 HD domain-containing protein [Desulfosarcina sp. OttesenSCG-928-B08]